MAGANHEECFNSAAYGGRVSNAKGAWADEADGLLADLPFRKYSLCMMNGPPAAGNRLYALASWWLTYDPRYSVAAPISPAPDGNAVFPEYAIVPSVPKESAAGGGIRALYRDGVSTSASSSAAIRMLNRLAAVRRSSIRELRGSRSRG